jgi:hypothetical protein
MSRGPGSRVCNIALTKESASRDHGVEAADPSVILNEASMPNDGSYLGTKVTYRGGMAYSTRSEPERRDGAAGAPIRSRGNRLSSSITTSTITATTSGQHGLGADHFRDAVQWKANTLVLNGLVPNARWGTLYNFRIDANARPARTPSRSATRWRRTRHDAP